jgi:hypothetical protein
VIVGLTPGHNTFHRKPFLTKNSTGTCDADPEIGFDSCGLVFFVQNEIHICTVCRCQTVPCSSFFVSLLSLLFHMKFAVTQLLEKRNDEVSLVANIQFDAAESGISGSSSERNPNFEKIRNYVGGCC